MNAPSKIEPTDIPGKLEALEGWTANDALTSVTREFTFSNFYETMAFVNALAWIAHSMDHHPDLQVGYKTCEATYTTHSAGGLTSLDFEAAGRLNGLLPS